jgi:crotonobetainyl-CoA:carnitine CoA-transferase CaiB-like acyl-CoA transferase
VDLLSANDVWCAPVRTYADLENDPQVVHKGLIWDVPYADTDRSYRTIGSPFTFSASDAALRRGAPRSGQHTAEFKAREIWKG